MNKHFTLMLCGLVVGLVITVLWMGSENARQQEGIASLNENLNATQSALASVQLELTRKQEQIAMIRKTATQAQGSLKRMYIMCGYSPTGASIHWIGLTKEIQADVDTFKKTLEVVSKER